MKTARSYLSTDFRTHREGMRGQKPYLSISDQFCILGQTTQSLGQDFVAARCLPVRDIKGTECKTVVAGCRSIDNANPIQNALREHQLAQPSYSALLCNALLWTSTRHYHSFVHNPACDEAFFCRLHSESSVTCQALLASNDTQRASLIWSRPYSSAGNHNLCMS